MVYVAPCCQIARVDLHEIQSLIMKFIWRGRPPKVAQSTLCQSTKHGGLNAVNVFHFYEALRLTWLPRILRCTNSTWCTLLQGRLGEFSLKDAIRIRKGKYYVGRLRIPEFYREIMISFQDIRQKLPIKTSSEVRMQSLWYNDNIKINHVPIFRKHMYHAGLKVVGDIADMNGNLLNYDAIKRKYPNVRSNFLEIQSVLSAIPLEWKTILRRERGSNGSLHGHSNIFLHVEQKPLELRHCKCRHFMSCLTEIREPTSVRRWDFFNIRPQSWREIYELPYKCTRATRLQALHFRIVNRYIPTRKYLCTRGVVGSPLCLKCFGVDWYVRPCPLGWLSRSLEPVAGGTCLPACELRR